MTFEEWVIASYPPLSMSVKQVAMWLGMTAQHINSYCKRGLLVRDYHSQIKTDHPENLAWFINRVGADVRPKAGGRGRFDNTVESKPKPAKVKPAPTPGREWGDKEPRWITNPGGDSGEVDLETILDALNNLDLNKLPGAHVQKIQRLESALKTRVERMQKRGQLIDRALVSTVFGRLYQIHSNEFRTLGAKLAPSVGGELGVENPEALLRIEQYIDDEVIGILSHVKRVFDKFLQDVGAEPCSP